MKESLKFEIGDLFLEKLSDFYRIHKITGFVVDVNNQRYYIFNYENEICRDLNFVNKNLIPVRYLSYL